MSNRFFLFLLPSGIEIWLLSVAVIVIDTVRWSTMVPIDTRINAKKVSLFPFLSLLCFTSIFVLLSQFRKTPIPSNSQSVQSFEFTKREESRHEVQASFCDYSDGTWIYDQNARTSRYDNTCKEIFKGWNCISSNKSNVREIVKWRWKPRQCDLPLFDPIGFLQKFRDTSIGTLPLSTRSYMFLVF